MRTWSPSSTSRAEELRRTELGERVCTGALLKALCARVRWPGEKVSIVLGDFSPYKHANVWAWATAHDIELIVLPTYDSWLN